MKWIYIIGGSLAAYMTVVYNYKYFNGHYEIGDVIAHTVGYFLGSAMVAVGLPALIVSQRRKKDDGGNDKGDLA